MKIFITSLLLTVLCIALTGCPTPLCLNPEPSYTFPVTAGFTPEQDSIRVGDTLFLVSEFPTALVPLGGQQPVDYSGSTGIGSTLNLLRLESGRTSTPAVASFEYVNVWGRIYNSTDIPSPERVQQLRFEENDGKYKLRVGLIPKEPGIYSLIVGNGLSNGRFFGDRCLRAAFQITVDNPNPHMHYLKTHTDTPLEQIPRIHYLFKVY